MDVLGSVGLRARLDEWVHFCTYAECVEAGNFEDLEFCSDGRCVG